MRPGLSPDGNRVAFFWGGEKNTDGGLYVATVGQPEKQRLTISRPGHVVPLEGGLPTQFVNCAAMNGVSSGPADIYYVPCDGPKRKLYAKNTDSGEVTFLAFLDGLLLASSVAVSSDGKRIMYSHARSMGVDVLLIENFR